MFDISVSEYLLTLQEEQMHKDRLLKALKYVIAFKQYNVNITPDDVLNLLIDFECVEHSEIMNLIDFCTKNPIKPVVPPNHIG